MIRILRTEPESMCLHVIGNSIGVTELCRRAGDQRREKLFARKLRLSCELALRSVKPCSPHHAVEIGPVVDEPDSIILLLRRRDQRLAWYDQLIIALVVEVGRDHYLVAI